MYISYHLILNIWDDVWNSVWCTSYREETRLYTCYLRLVSSTSHSCHWLRHFADRHHHSKLCPLSQSSFSSSPISPLPFELLSSSSWQKHPERLNVTTCNSINELQLWGYVAMDQHLWLPCLGGWRSINQLSDVHQGYRVLTHSHVTEGVTQPAAGAIRDFIMVSPAPPWQSEDHYRLRLLC